MVSVCVVYHEFRKPGIPFTTINKWWIWIMHGSKSVQKGLQGTGTSFCSTATFHPRHRKWSETIFLHLAGNSLPPVVFTILGPVWLSFVSIEVSRGSCGKMAWWQNHLKKRTVFLREHPQLVREMGKMCSYMAHTFNKDFLLASNEIKRVFLYKK